MWEYEKIVLNYTSLPEFNIELNKIGDMGWEITNFTEEKTDSGTKVVLLVKRKKAKIIETKGILND